MCGEDQATPVARPRKRRAWRRLLAETRAEILRHAGYLVRATR
jgi:hypothetical protein